MSAQSLPNILIVEDSDDIRMLLETLLSEEGFEINCASNGKEALEFLANCEILPSVILLDLSMPIMDGYQFREAQLNDSRLSLIPIILMTAAGDTQMRAQKVAAAASLKKPFADIEDILSTVKSFLP